MSVQAHRLRRADVQPPVALLVPLHRAVATPTDTQRGAPLGLVVAVLNVFRGADEEVVVVFIVLVAAGAGAGGIELPPH